MSAIISIATSLAVLGPGALAAADPGVLDAVEMTRIKYGYGLDGLAGPGVVKLAVEDCNLLGHRGYLIVEGSGIYPACVVDCQQEKHEPLSERGLLADVDRADLGHRQAFLMVWDDGKRQNVRRIE